MNLEAKQPGPTSIRLYPPVEKAIKNMEIDAARQDKYFNRNHHINMAIAMMHSIPIETLDVYKREKKP